MAKRFPGLLNSSQFQKWMVDCPTDMYSLNSSTVVSDRGMIWLRYFYAFSHVSFPAAVLHHGVRVGPVGISAVGAGSLGHSKYLPVSVQFFIINS